MDTITHGIVGALAGKAFFAGPDEPAHFNSGGAHRALSSPTAKAAIVACTIGSVFPDIDIFAGRLARNPLAIMEWHRNITHSLVMLPVWALLLAWASQPLARRLRWKLPPFPRLALIYAVALFSHIFLDLATSFGTMTWSPLNYSRLAWDWIFIVDFTFSGIALVPQLAAWCYREPERFPKRAAVVWAVLSAGVLG
ncbi:MAG: metal-dependent hydrolase, partial [Candidatus Acidiferrales bacterium]